MHKSYYYERMATARFIQFRVVPGHLFYAGNLKHDVIKSYSNKVEGCCVGIAIARIGCRWCCFALVIRLRHGIAGGGCDVTVSPLCLCQACQRMLILTPPNHTPAASCYCCFWDFLTALLLRLWRQRLGAPLVKP